MLLLFAVWEFVRHTEYISNLSINVYTDVGSVYSGNLFPTHNIYLTHLYISTFTDLIVGCAYTGNIYDTEYITQNIYLFV